MGNCLYNDKQPVDLQPRQFDEETLKSSTSPKTEKKSHYKSELLTQNINQLVIPEEDSSKQQSSLLQYSDDDLKRTSVKSRKNSNLNLTEIQKSFPFGEEIIQNMQVRLMNISTNRFLHSHAVKYESGSKSNEVSACSEGYHDYDNWQIISEEQHILHKNIIIIRHCLTGLLMRSNQKFLTPKSKQQQVSCSGHLQDIQEEDYWKIEIISNAGMLRSNSIIRIKHHQTEGYLQSTRQKGIIQNHLEIVVSQKCDFQDLWIVQIVSQ